MELKSFVVVLLAMGLVLCDQDETSCSPDRASDCVDTLLERTLSGSATSDEEMCPILRDTAKCLRQAADDCLGENRDSSVDDALSDMDEQIRQTCPEEAEQSNEESSEDVDCLKENQEYILGCLSESTNEALELASLGPNVVKCTFYSLVAHCVTSRAEEKCGEDAAAEIKKEVDDVPEEIQEACSAQDTIDLFSIATNMEERRKK